MLSSSRLKCWLGVLASSRCCSAPSQSRRSGRHTITTPVRCSLESMQAWFGVDPRLRRQINVEDLSHHFWHITEYLLNTLLFALGGAVWGDIIALSYKDSTSYTWTWNDWVRNSTQCKTLSYTSHRLKRQKGYLVMLYVFVNLIRFVLVFAFYPITARLGVGTNWREAVFMVRKKEGSSPFPQKLISHSRTEA